MLKYTNKDDGEEEEEEEDEAEQKIKILSPWKHISITFKLVYAVFFFICSFSFNQRVDMLILHFQFV